MLTRLRTSPHISGAAARGYSHHERSVDGHRIAWIERPAAATGGSTTTPPLLLIPGLSMSWRAWTWMLEQLPTERRILIVDPPGSGRSASLPGEMTTDRQAAHLDRWLTALGVDELDVVGHSLGAYTAARLAALRTDRVATVVLIATSPDPRWPRARRHVAALVRDGLRERPRVIYQAATDYVRSNPRLLAAFEEEISRTASDLLDGVSAKVVVVRGVLDEVSTHEWGAALAAVGGGPLVEVEDGPHGLPQHSPADLAQVLREHL